MLPQDILSIIASTAITTHKRSKIAMLSIIENEKWCFVITYLSLKCLLEWSWQLALVLNVFPQPYSHLNGLKFECIRMWIRKFDFSLNALLQPGKVHLCGWIPLCCFMWLSRRSLREKTLWHPCIGHTYCYFSFFGSLMDEGAPWRNILASAIRLFGTPKGRFFIECVVILFWKIMWG